MLVIIFFQVDGEPNNLKAFRRPRKIFELPKSILQRQGAIMDTPIHIWEGIANHYSGEFLAFSNVN